jgi:hypothetical protein
MDEPNALVPADLREQAIARADEFDDMTTSTAYLPRFQLFGSKSDACTEGKIPIGHYGLDKDGEITDLGEEVNILVAHWRPKAVDVNGDTPVNVFDAKSDLFADIKKRSAIKDSGCMYGPEFLVWVPTVSSFAVYHMNSKTARREAKKMPPFIGAACTMKCHLIDPPGSRYKWHGPLITPCSAPIDLPDDEELRKQFSEFDNPPAPELDVDGDSEEEGGRER